MTDEGAAPDASVDPPVRAVEPSRKQAAVCGTFLAIVTVYSIAVMPARPLLLGLAPATLAMVTGSRVALVALGVLAQSTGEPWLIPLLVAILSIMKFHWVFWWAGALWGDAVLIRLAGDSKRARASIRRAEALVRRFKVLAVAIAYVPLPIPRDLIYAALGTSGVKLKPFLVVDVLAAVVSQSFFLAAGMLVGEAAMPLMRAYATWAGVFALAVVLLMVWRWWRTRAKTPQDPQAA